MLNIKNPLVRFGKLLKYEILACARTFLPIYAALIFVSFAVGFSINEQMYGWEDSIWFMMLMIIYMGIFLASIIMTIVLLVQRFCKNLLKDEAYLSMTLPVGVSNHIMAKYVSCLIWIFLCSIIAVLSIFILLRETDFHVEFFKGTDQIVALISQITPANKISGFLKGLFALLGDASADILMFFAVFAVGHLTSKYRTVLEIITLVLFASIKENFTNFISLQFMQIQNFENATPEMINEFVVMASNNGMIYGLINFAFFGVFFAITYYVLAKKINLE